jgi:hypothetical protein
MRPELQNKLKKVVKKDGQIPTISILVRALLTLYFDDSALRKMVLDRIINQSIL